MPATDLSPLVEPTGLRMIGRGLRRVVAGTILTYSAVIVLFYALQTRIIFPGARKQGTPDARVQVPHDAKLIELPAGTQHIKALFGSALTPAGQPHPQAARQPTILFFYGNGDCLAHMEDEFTAFRRLGANVLIPEYIGYGLSTGRPSETGCYETGRAAYDWLLAQPQIHKDRILIAGWSLGAAVAVELAAERSPAGLVMLSAFTNMADMGRQVFPFLPTGWFLKHRFENLDKIGRVRCPIILAHGTQDDLVPFGMCGRLAAAATVRPTLIHVEQASHNDLFAVGGQQVLEALGRMIAAVCSRQ